MKPSTEKLRADAERDLRRATLCAAVVCLALAGGGLRLAQGGVDLLYGDARVSSFVCGAATGILAVAAAVAVRRVVGLRRALADDAALRRMRAREHDELRAHVEREAALAFAQALPALFAVAIAAAGFAGVEALAAVAATVVFLSAALLAAKLACRARWRAGSEEE